MAGTILTTSNKNILITIYKQNEQFNIFSFEKKIVQSPVTAVVRKVNAAGTQNWLASISYQPVEESLWIDAAENYVYFSLLTYPLVVIRLNTSSGSIYSVHGL